VFPSSLTQILASVDLPSRLRIARQFIPSKKEFKQVEGFNDDPMCEEGISGDHAGEFVHKYPDKILVLASKHCPILCRFCTRKRITYDQPLSAGEIPPSPSQSQDRREGRPHRINLERIVRYMEAHVEIQEVIFSGGDPFMLSNQQIDEMLSVFIKLPRVKKIRFHSRAATILPGRFTPQLFSVFKRAMQKYPEKKITLVIHANHPAELSAGAISVIRQFFDLNVAVYCQTVLLRNVNDQVSILARLFEKLAQAGIRPYYLHQLDRITGSAHFEVDIDRGIEIVRQLQKILPRCLVPAYVTDGPEGKKKIL